MKLTRLDIVHWEPCVIRFVFTPQTFGDEFQRFVDSWLHKLGRSPECDCKYRYAEFLSEPNNAHILRTEWACDVCIEALAAAVNRRFPGLQRVELGVSAVVRGGKPGLFVNVPQKTVELEDGTKLLVNALSIAKRPVSVGEFEAFVRRSGHVTTAERQRSAENFRDHFGLSSQSIRARAEAPAQFVSLADADAFCQEAGMRLPTEAEWLAAAILDPRELDITPAEEFDLRTKPPPPNALEVTCWEITSTRVPGNLVVARRGPLQFVQKGWREEAAFNFHRRLISIDHFDMSITFRVAKRE